MPFLRKNRTAAPTTGRGGAGAFADQRRSMVERQLQGRGIRSTAVLDVMGRVPREAFVLPRDRDYAYEDRPLPIGHGATISQPYIVALMTEELAPVPADRVLEIGTGSGYQTAILAEMAAEVFTVEIIAKLAERARSVLEDVGYRNVRFRTGDGRAGWPEEAPFDAVLVTAAPARLPARLLDELGIGGRLVAPVGEVDQRLILWRRSRGGVERTEITSVRFVPLHGEEEP